MRLPGGSVGYMTTSDGDPYEGLAADVAQLLAAAPVTDKRLLELRVTWTGLPAGPARWPGRCACS